MNDSIKTKKLNNGYTVNVHYDNDPQSPREWCNAGTVALINRSRYSFADEKLPHDEIQAIIDDPDYLSLPIYIYDHSGITINTTGFSCSWDSGQCGIIYISKSDAIKEWGKKILTRTVKQKTLDYLKGEIKTLDQFVTGSVYGYEILDENGDNVSSCWGFYGSIDECMNEGVCEAEAIHPDAGQLELNFETVGV